jgi:hypothetical protein
MLGWPCRAVTDQQLPQETCVALARVAAETASAAKLQHLDPCGANCGGGGHRTRKLNQTMQVDTENSNLADRLRHVRWIGGGSGAGKSTVARRLIADYGLRLYEVEPLSKHASRSDSESSPLLHAFIAMDMDERWLNRTPEVMFETFHGFHGEGFQFVIEDLLALPDDSLILVEGFTLVPRLIAPLLARRDQAVWLLPTPDFRRRAFETRGSTWTIAGKTSNPERALANLLERDRLFTERLRRELADLDLTKIEVDGSLTVDELVGQVAHDLI